MLNTKYLVFTLVSNNEKRVENMLHSTAFLAKVGVLGNVVKPCLECLIISQWTLKLKRKRKKIKLYKSMRIKIIYPSTIKVMASFVKVNQLITSWRKITCNELYVQKFLYVPAVYCWRLFVLIKTNDKKQTSLHDVTAAMQVFQNNEMGAMLVYHTNLVRV